MDKKNLTTKEKFDLAVKNHKKKLLQLTKSNKPELR